MKNVNQALGQLQKEQYKIILFQQKALKETKLILIQIMMLIQYNQETITEKEKQQ